MSWKVKEGHGRSFPITKLTSQVRKFMGGGRWSVGLYCQPQSQAFSSRLCILDLGLGFGTGLGLDINYERYTYLAESVCRSVSQ